MCTDPLVVTGALASSEIATRTPAGFYLFVPPGYDERILVDCGFRILHVVDTTLKMADVARKRLSARASREHELRKVEGDQAYRVQQGFLASVESLARENKLSRFLLIAEK